jgi:hypothetical protein
MGWLSRAVNRHVFAMASWHLFHQGRFIPWAIRKMAASAFTAKVWTANRSIRLSMFSPPLSAR